MWMTGSFNSAQQAADDSTYFDITLHMRPIWPNRTDARWLYVEQAVTAMPGRPYRQRVYRVKQVNDSLFESAVFALGSDSLYIGAWKSDSLAATLAFDSLLVRTGCAVYLKPTENGTFKGKTNERDCESTLRGAQYATSEVEVFADKIISWDQGFDSTGVQVWGATEGGYVFDRVP